MNRCSVGFETFTRSSSNQHLDEKEADFCCLLQIFHLVLHNNTIYTLRYPTKTVAKISHNLYFHCWFRGSRKTICLSHVVHIVFVATPRNERIEFKNLLSQNVNFDSSSGLLFIYCFAFLSSPPFFVTLLLFCFSTSSMNWKFWQMFYQTFDQRNCLFQQFGERKKVSLRLAYPFPL